MVAHKKRKSHVLFSRMLHFQYAPLCCHCNCQLCHDLFISPRGRQFYYLPPRSVSILYQLDVWWLSGHMCGPLWSRPRLSGALHDLSYLPQMLISNPQGAALVQDEAQSWKIFDWEIILSDFFFFSQAMENNSSYYCRYKRRTVAVTLYYIKCLSKYFLKTSIILNDIFQKTSNRLIIQQW